MKKITPSSLVGYYPAICGSPGLITLSRASREYWQEVAIIESLQLDGWPRITKAEDRTADLSPIPKADLQKETR